MPVLALAALAGCGGESQAGDHPCLVPEEELAEIVDRDGVFASPQSDDVTCIYATGGQPLVALAVRTPEQFGAERARFEDEGVLLPELVPVEGFEDEASLDPRHDSLNVAAGDLIISVEIVTAEPADQDERLEVEKAIARAAVERV